MPTGPYPQDERVENKLVSMSAAVHALELVQALEAFEEQAVKVSGFPDVTTPFSGALVLARAALRAAKGEAS